MVSSTVGSSTCTGWKAALQSGVFLDILAVLVQRGRADAVQLAAGQHGFQQIAGVHCAVGLAGTHDGVQLINEEDDLALALLHLIQDALQTLLELAAVLCASTRAPMSKLNTVRSFRFSGTSPRTIRWARPSAMAVLPTPAHR